jgi:predicted phage-related endonuclease
VVGGSETGSLVGIGFESKRELWYRKGKFPDIELPPRPDNARMESGRDNEITVLNKVARLYPHLKIVPVRIFACDLEKFLGATLDAKVIEPDGTEVPLEAKTIGMPPDFDLEWENGDGEPGKGRAPFRHVLQLMTQMLMLGVSHGYLAGMVISAFDSRLALVRVEYHAGTAKRLEDEARQFFADIAAGREPEFDYKRDRELIAMLSPKEVPDKVIDLFGDNELRAMLIERADLKDRIKTDTARCEEIEAEIMDKMGDAERVSGIPDFRITWKTSHFNAFTMPERDKRVLRIYDRRKPTKGEAA